MGKTTGCGSFIPDGGVFGSSKRSLDTLHIYSYFQASAESVVGVSRTHVQPSLNMYIRRQLLRGEERAGNNWLVEEFL